MFLICCISCMLRYLDFKRKPFLLSADLYDIIGTILRIKFFNDLNKLEERFHYVSMGSDKEKS